MIEAYTIDRIEWEAYCEHCGTPLDLGDRAYLVNETSVTCSHTCAQREMEIAQ